MTVSMPSGLAGGVPASGDDAGGAHVDAATRQLSGPAGTARLEPRAMAVFELLRQNAGQVMTRGDLLDICWQGRIVGDDSLNRIIQGIRRTLREVGLEQTFRIETVPKSGYRLLVAEPIPDDPGLPAPGIEGLGVWDRRTVLALGGTALAAGGLAWRSYESRGNPRVAELVEQARTAQRSGLPDDDPGGIGFLNEALTLEPRNAQVWGLLALGYFNLAEQGAGDTAFAVAQCESAARRALALDAAESNALAALAVLPPIYGDWLNAERRYDAALKRHPDSVPVIEQKGLLLMSVGRCRDALAQADRAVALDPFSPLLHYHRSFRLSAVGKNMEADRSVDRALQLWPTHPGLRYARFLIFAFSNRPEAARRILLTRGGDGLFPPPLAAAWAEVFRAQTANDPAIRERAIAMFVAKVSANTAAAVNAMLAVSLLKDVDTAFAIAEGYLLRRGRFVGELHTVNRVAVTEQRFRKTMMLFAPPTASMRADPRFATLAEEMGLAAYWRASGHYPDYMGSRA